MLISFDEIWDSPEFQGVLTDLDQKIWKEFQEVSPMDTKQLSHLALRREALAALITELRRRRSRESINV